MPDDEIQSGIARSRVVKIVLKTKAKMMSLFYDNVFEVSVASQIGCMTPCNALSSIKANLLFINGHNINER